MSQESPQSLTGIWPTHGCPSVNGAFPINSRPRGLSAGPLAVQFQWAHMLLLRPVPLPNGHRILWLGGYWRCVGQADSISDKSSSLNSLKKISKSGKATSAPASHCSWAVISPWCCSTAPPNTQSPSLNPSGNSLIFTHCLEKPAFGPRSGYFPLSQRVRRLSWWHC